MDSCLRRNDESYSVILAHAGIHDCCVILANAGIHAPRFSANRVAQRANTVNLHTQHVA